MSTVWITECDACHTEFRSHRSGGFAKLTEKDGTTHELCDDCVDRVLGRVKV